tara:strand:- start:111333 stop:112091 length:759 start_codon:yes stop_codon:yes gene_type:complete
MHLSSDIDRVAPTRRPAGKNAGTQRWRDLLFLHWQVSPQELRALVPSELELDLFEGTAYLGVVPFAMQGVRPSWLPARLAFRFLETNVRAYVHYNGRPGVYFFSLEAASWLAVKAARVGWGLPYHYAAMKQVRDESGITRYSTTRKSATAPHLTLQYTTGEFLEPSSPDSLEFFLLERYLLFSQHKGRLQCGQVHHPPYPAQRATLLALEESLVAAAGVSPPQSLPPLVHYASGVDVEVFPLRAVDEKKLGP